MKINKTHIQIIDHIKNITNIDITDLSEPILRGMICVDVSDFTENSINNLYRIADQYKKVSIQPAGYKKIAISMN